MEPKTIKLTGVSGNAIVADLRGPEDGAPLIFLHGGGQTRHSWGATAARLADAGWRTVSVDLRGHGESDWVRSGDYSLRSFAGDVGVVAAELARPPLVVGASLGGLTAVMLEGVLAPGTLRAIALVDVIPNMERSGTQRIQTFMEDRMAEGFETLDEVADAIAAYNPERPRPSDLDGLKKNLRLCDDGRWRWHWDPKFLGGLAGTGPAEIADVGNLNDAIGRIAGPMLLVRGRMSDVVSEAGAQDFLERFPHIAFVDVSEAGHMVAGDRNDTFTVAITDWVATLGR